MQRKLKLKCATIYVPLLYTVVLLSATITAVPLLSIIADLRMACLRITAADRPLSRAGRHLVTLRLHWGIGGAAIYGKETYETQSKRIIQKKLAGFAATQTLSTLL